MDLIYVLIARSAKAQAVKRSEVTELPARCCDHWNDTLGPRALPVSNVSFAKRGDPALPIESRASRLKQSPVVSAYGQVTDRWNGESVGVTPVLSKV